MREWMLKHQKIIIAVTAVIFVGGIVWWSVAAYIGGRNQPGANGFADSGYVPSRGEALLVITRGAEDFPYNYWIMPWELREDMLQILQYYRQFGIEVDEIFQEPTLEVNQLLAMMDEQIIQRYADLHGIQPNALELERRVNEIVDPNIQDDSIRQQILWQFGSIDAYKNLVRANLEQQMTREAVQNKVASVSEEQMRQYYEEHREELASEHDEVMARHILVEEEVLAQTLKDQIQAGAISFEEAAKTHSLDGTSEDGGDLGWIRRGMMVADFEQAVFTAPVGEVVGPVRTQFGFHLIRVDDQKSIESYEDFALFSEEYEEARDGLKKEAFEKWLEAYKSAEQIDYVINDDILAVFDKYQRVAREPEDTLKAKEAFAEELKEFVLYEEDGVTTIIPGSEPRIVGLFISLQNEFAAHYQKILSDLIIWEYLIESVPQDLQNKDISMLEADLTQVAADLQQASDSGERTELQKKQYALEDAIQLHKQEQLLQNHGISIDEVHSTKELLLQKEKDARRWIQEGYSLLYAYNTTSKQVLQNMYQFYPNDPDVALHYYQNTYYELAPYVKDPETFAMYQSMIEPELSQIQLGFTRIARDPDTPLEQRIIAYENLIVLLEDWRKYDLELAYLKELKELDPDYRDIDEIIELVELMAQEHRELLVTEPELDLSSPLGTPTFDFPGLGDEEPGLSLPGIDFP